MIIIMYIREMYLIFMKILSQMKNILYLNGPKTHLILLNYI